MDAAGPDAVRPWVERAWRDAPPDGRIVALVDPAHLLASVLGVTNVPTSAWVDEHGTLVRCGDPAFLSPNPVEGRAVPDDVDPVLRATLDIARDIHTDHESYAAAVRDWAVHGAGSRFALPPDEVVRRSRLRPPEEARAIAHFELGSWCRDRGDEDGATVHWREAHRLVPDGWTWKRQAWSLVDPLQGPSDRWEGWWAADVRAQGGAAAYYPPFVP